MNRPPETTNVRSSLLFQRRLPASGFPAKPGNPEIVDHVGRLDSDEHAATHGNVNYIRRNRVHGRVGYFPPPLMSGHDDVRLARDGMIYCARRSNAQHKQDGHEQNGDRSPDDLEFDVTGCLFRLLIVPLAVADNNEQNRSSDDGENGSTDPHARVP